MNAAASHFTVSDKHVPVEAPSGEIPVRYVKPSGGTEDTFPVLVWFHGGGQVKCYPCYGRPIDGVSVSSTGFALGDLEMDDMHLRTIAVELKLAIVNVGYRLVPLAREC